MLQAMLDELPPALQPGQSNVVKEEKIKLERLHEKQKIGKAELPTWEEMTIDIAIMLKDIQGQKTKTPVSHEVNNYEKSYKGALKGANGKGKGQGAGKAGAAAQTAKGVGKGKGGAGSGKGGKGGATKCGVCGKEGTTTKLCACLPCPSCNLRYCTGAPGAAKVTGLGCAQELDVFPEYSSYTQANGKLPYFLFEKARKKWHTKWNIPYEASAASINEDGTAAGAEWDGGWTYEIEASVCELIDANNIEEALESSAAERNVYKAITKGHTELLNMRDEMFIDETNTPRLKGYITFLIDSGANTPLFQSAALISAATPTSSKQQHASVNTVKGGESLALEGEATVNLLVRCANGQHELIQVKGQCASQARRNIIYEEFFEKMGAVNGLRRCASGERTWDIMFNSGAKWLTLMCNDLIFGFARLRDEDTPQEINELDIIQEVNASETPSIVWAARLGCGSEGLKAAQLAARNMAMPKITTTDAHIIDHDRHRREMVAKRQPMNPQRNPIDRSYTPGSSWVFDAFTYPGRGQVKMLSGKTGAPAPTAMLHAWDDSGSDFGYCMNVPQHTVDEWEAFIAHVIVSENHLGHTVKKIKLDRAPELDCEDLKRRIEVKHGAKVFIAPSGEHAGIHRAEAHMDPLTRTTEAMLQRAKRNLPGDLRQYAALARKYANWITDRRPPNMGAPSRLQKHCGRVPDFGDKNGMTPYVFGCQVVRLKDENERTGWKGVGNRAIAGIFVGIEQTSYLVLNLLTRKITKEPYIWPVDERELAMGGVAAGAMQHDAEVQCELPITPLVCLPSSDTRPLPKIKPVVKTVEAPVGTRLEVYWAGQEGHQGWYKGTVIALEAIRSGEARHVIEYDGFPGDHRRHDLVNHKKEWRILNGETLQGTPVDAAFLAAKNSVEPDGAQGDALRAQIRARDEAAAALGDPQEKNAACNTRFTADPVERSYGVMQFGTQDPKTGSMRAPTSQGAAEEWKVVQPRKGARKLPTPPTRTTRHSNKSVAEVALEALEHIPVDASSTQAVIEVLMGELAPPSQPGDEPETILERVASVPYKGWQLPQELSSSQAKASALEIMSTSIEYTTESGEKARIDQPKGTKQVMQSPDRDKWLEAHRKAFAALKAIRGNKMQRLPDVEGEGPLFHCVTVNVVKTFAETNKLDKLSARHSIDGGPRGKEVLRKAGIESTTPTSSTTMDEVVMKMIFSQAAKEKRFLTKADVKTAYQNATTKRGRRFMRCPETCREYDDDGTEMVLELGPPLFGEPEAGYEWQCTLERDLREFGWVQCENVGCLWRFATADDVAILGTIVDDLLFSEGNSHRIAERTVEFLRKKYIGVSMEHEPKSYAGYKITRSPARDVITLSMPELIEAKMKEFCPELISAKARKDFKAQHVGGDKLEKLADAMIMEEPRADGKRTKHGKTVMQLTGCVRYFMRASAGELNVIGHRLSSVQARAPPEAVIVAQAAMIMAYEERERGITYSAHNHGAAAPTTEANSIDVSFATGVPREPGIHAVADCSWGARNLYGCLIMMNYGAIVCETKKMGPVDSSAEGEGITTSKCAELLEPVQEAARAMGIPLTGPITIRSDNLSSVRVANDPKAAGRLRHALRRFATLQQRVAREEVQVIHIPDRFNAADFLTKWVSVKKLKESIAYTSNEAAKPKG